MSAPGGTVQQPTAQAAPPPYYPPQPYYYYPPPPIPTMPCPRCGAPNYYGIDRCHQCSKYLRGEKHSMIGGLLITLVGVGELVLAIIFSAAVGVFGFGGVCTVVLLILGLLALTGGISALTKKNYALAVLGGICTVFSIIGIIGLILVAMSKDDFE